MQNSNHPIPTVYDVAERAGVSRGTVDRVLYQRGRVSEQSRQKVLRAVEELQYKPNSNASRLARKKEYLFSCIIPQFNEGEYWGEINNGFLEAAALLSERGVRLRLHFYDQTDVKSFLAESNAALDDKPCGIIMNAVFRDEVTLFSQQLDELGLPYAFIDNKIDETHYALYYGVDPYKSGELGAWLLSLRFPPKEIALVRLLRDSSQRADPNRPRRHGFTDYINKHFPDCTVHTVFIDPKDSCSTQKTLEKFFAEHPGIKHICMTNSRIFLLEQYLREHPEPERIVVGFDELKHNLKCLERGYVNVLVTRHIPEQSKLLLTDFAESVISRRAPKRRDHYVHMDILTRMNLDNY